MTDTSQRNYDASSDLLCLGVRLSDECLSFARAMKELYASDFDWLYFLEKPYKWARQFEVWVEHGRPADDSEPQWDHFALLALAL